MIDSILAVVAVALMVISLLLTILPFIPGPALVWAIGVIFAALTNFERVTVLSVIVMTVFMVLGSTSELWMQIFGMKARGSSCLAIIGSLLGGLVGTFFIPIPILGTILGMVVGAVIFEFARLREVKESLHAGSTALVAYTLSAIVELVFGLLILAVFVISLLA